MKGEKLRIYFLILGTKPFYKSVKSPKEAKLIIDAIADFINFKVDEGFICDHCNTAGLEYFDEEENEWLTWYDEDGNDLDEHFNRENKDEQ